MDFKETQSIYLQIADYVCEQILTHRWKIGERVMSIRELGGVLEVNPNTVLRTYDFLQTMEIIVNKRGVGYFVADNAIEKIITFRKNRFIKEELPHLFKNMRLLQIDITEIEKRYNEFNK